MYRKCKRFYKIPAILVLFSTGYFILVLYFALRLERKTSIIPTSDIVKRVPDVLKVQFTRYMETTQPSRKLSTHSAVNLKTERPDSAFIISAQTTQPSRKLSTHSAVNLKTERPDSAFIKSAQRSASVCPKREIMNSSIINKLGSYPQGKRYLTIGISSITRPSGQSYLARFVQLLIDNLSDKDRKEVYIIIFLADFDEKLKNASLTKLLNSFKTSIGQGLLHAIVVPREYYPPLSNLKTKFGDSQPRIFWRSKLVVDFSFLMCYCKDLSQYYLHLEDDLIPAPSFYPKLQDFITSQKIPWPILDAAYMGHTAKVYHSNDLENIANYFYLMYDEMPADWLIEFWRRIKYETKYYRDFVLPPASLFQHIGNDSSFIENKNSYKSKEKYFDEYDVKYNGLNPSAIVSSSMSSDTRPENAYNKGSGYFWAKGVKKDDFIIIKFSSVTTIHEMIVETGSYLAPKDQLISGVLQASFQKNSTEMEANDVPNCKDFDTIGNFKDGRVKVSLIGSRKVFCLRVLVTKDQAEWLFVREIDVW